MFTKSPCRTKNRELKKLHIRYSIFKPGMDEKELRGVFDAWYGDRYWDRQIPESPHSAFKDEFEAFKAGIGPDSIPYKNYIIPETHSSCKPRGFDTVEFPPIVEGKPILQFRPYDKHYNENRLFVGQRVSIWKTEEYPDNCEDETLGTVSGIRKMQIRDLPKKNQEGILTHYNAKGLDLSEGTIFMFWVEEDPPMGDYNSPEDVHMERNDITDD